MKICLINNLYKPYSRGGAEKVVELVAEKLIKKGHEVFIVATKPIFRIADCRLQIADCYYIKGFYYYLSDIPKFLRLFWHLIDMFDVGSFLKVRSILKKEKPDIVMTHNLKGIGYLIPSAIRKFKIRHIHTLHDIQLIHPSGLMMYGQEKKVNSMLAKIYANICRWLINSPDVVISPSKWLLNLHEEKGFFKKSKKVVLSNPMETPHTPLLKGGAVGVFRFLYVGQIEEHKGILFLFEAFKSIPPPYEGGGWGRLELLIVGDGSKMAEAQKLADDTSGIQFLGKKNKDEVASLMREADCLIVPSLCYENSPTVIYEAFAAGLPVVASNLGGIPELLENGAGILFKAGDENDLAEKMKWATENKEKLKNIGEEGSKRVKNFNLESYLDKLLRLL